MKKNRFFHILDVLGLFAVLSIIACGPPAGDAPPIVEFPTSSQVETTSAVLGGNVTDDQGGRIFERGVVYSPTATNSNPTVEGIGVKKVTTDGEEGVFTVTVTGLEPGTEYSFAAYAINGAGTGYTDPVSTFKTLAAAGANDENFAPAVSGNDPNHPPFVQATAVQPDGKTIIGGFFETVGGHFHASLARLLVDGTIDTNFVAQVTGPSGDTGVAAILVQPDGKILIAGRFTKVNGLARVNIARLNPDGTVDLSFNPKATADDAVLCLALQRDGKILAGGVFANINGQPRSCIARLLADGTLDAVTNFNASVDIEVKGIAVQEDGQILICGGFNNVNSTNRPKLARLNPDGSLEGAGTFNPNVAGTVNAGALGAIYCLAVQEDGQIVIGGDFATVDGASRPCLARLNADGTGETAATFDPGTGPTGTTFRAIFCLATQVDGKILVGGSFNTFAAQFRNRIARLNSDGSVEDEDTFNTGNGALGPSPCFVYSISVRQDGKIMVGGSFVAFNNKPAQFVALLNNGEATQGLYALNGTDIQWARSGTAPGLFGVTFESSTDGGVTWTMEGNGSPASGGWELTGLTLPTEGLIRARGFVSAGFSNGSAGLIEQISPIAGGPAVVTTPTSMNVTGDSADLGGNVTMDGGTPVSVRGVVYSPTNVNANPSLGDDGTEFEEEAAGLGVFSLNVSNLEPNTHYSFRAYAINDYGTSYSPVATFTTLGPPIVAEATTAGSIDDVSAFLGGNVIADGGLPLIERGVVYYQGSDPDADRLLSEDSVTRVAEGGTTTGDFTVLVGGLTPNTDYSFAAYATNVLGTTYSNVSRFKTANAFVGGRSTGGGSRTSSAIDTNFAPDLTGTFVQAIAVQPNGKTIIGGIFTTVGGESHHSLARLNADGSVDSTFTASTNGSVFAMAVQNDGKIVIGGAFSTVNGVARNSVARLNADGTLDSAGSFAPGSGTDGIVYGLALQADGKIVLGGLFTTVDGEPRKNLARLNADGSLEALATFDPGTGPDDAVYSVAVQPDGQILIGGAFENVDGTARNRIARLDPDGAVEDGMTFNPGTGADNRVFAVAVQADNQILIGGSFTNVGGEARGHIARLNVDGSLEDAGTFDPGTGADGNVCSLAVQTNGKILLGGTFQNVDGTPRDRVARLNSDGSLDLTGVFDLGAGAAGEVDGVAVQVGGQVLLGGGFTDSVALKLLARVNNDAATQSLTIGDTGDLEWLRGGAGPEVSRAYFEVSINGGVSWTFFGEATRIAGGWKLTGQTLPARGILRARGRTAGGYLNSSSGLVEEKIDFPTTIPVKDGLVTGGGTDTFGAIGTPQTGAFAGTVKAGKVKSAAIFAADGSVILEVGVNGISKLGAPNGGAVLATLKPDGGAITTKNNVQLMIGLNSGAPVVGAQTGTAYPNLPAGVTIKKFLAIDGQGSTTFFLATMQGGDPKKSPALCSVSAAGNVRIVASKDQDVTIGANTRKVTTLATLVGIKGTLAANRWRVDDTNFGIRVTFPDKQQALFVVPGTATIAANWTLMTQTGPLGDSITGLNGATVSTFGLPGFGDTNVAQVVKLAIGPGNVTKKTNVALTTGNRADGFRLLARNDHDARDAKGNVMVGVFYKALFDPVSGANGAVAFAGTLTGAGVDGKNRAGLWFATDGVTPKLMARTGDLAPGGGRWKEFTTLVLPDDSTRGPIFLGKVVVDAAEGVTKTNNTRLWAVDSTGNLQMIFRTAQDVTVKGATKQVKSFIALVPALGSVGAANGYDSNGNVAVLATFTDATQALLVLTVP